MQKFAFVILALVLLINMRGSAGNLIQQVPAKSPAFAALRMLDQHKMLTTGRDALFTGTAPRSNVTRYDIALALIEPLSQFVALADTAGTVGSSPEQYLRRESAYRTFSSLSQNQLNHLLSAANQLLVGFADVIEELSPGLPAQAASALRKINKAATEYKISDTTAGNHLTLRVTVDPNVEPDPFRSPLPLLPIKRDEPDVQLMIAPRAGEQGLLGVRPVNSLEAAVDLAFSGFRLYGAVSTLDKDPRLLIRPDQLSGSAMVGLQFNIARLDDLGITGILEYHVLRSSDPVASNTNTGAVTGIGIIW